MDFSDNPMAEPDFKFYDKSLLDDVKRGDPNVHEFFRLLALCHTVMPEYKEGKYKVLLTRSYSRTQERTDRRAFGGRFLPR